MMVNGTRARDLCAIGEESRQHAWHYSMRPVYYGAYLRYRECNRCRVVEKKMDGIWERVSV